jgi:glycerate-2-kinase
MIRNKENLLENFSGDEKEYRSLLLNILDTVFENIDPYNLVLKYLKKQNYEHYENIYVVGAGKGASRMAKAARDFFGDRISKGHIIIPRGEKDINLKGIKHTFASHPLPDIKGVAGAKEVLSIAKEAGDGDLIVSLISGGGSSLMPLPPENVPLDDKVKTTSLLLNSGADIYEINKVRKHLSGIKGGFLAKAAYPAEVLNLVVSDVIGDDLSIIASGPMSPDPSTFDDAISVLKKYDLLEKAPESVKDHLKKAETETPKPGSGVFEKVKSFILANHETAAKEAQKIAEQYGQKNIILTTNLDGECRRQAKSLVKTIKKTETLYILTGETTVNVTGSGCGGRNQEFVLAYINEVKDEPGKFAILSAGTDGVDGMCPKKVAGAIASPKTLTSAEDKNLIIDTYIKNNDSFSFFKESGEHIITGPTGTNLGDIVLLIKYD